MKFTVQREGDFDYCESMEFSSLDELLKWVEDKSAPLGVLLRPPHDPGDSFSEEFREWCKSWGIIILKELIIAP